MSRMAEHFFADAPAHFDGATFDPKRDGPRLKGLLGRVFWEMNDGEWHTLAWLSHRTGGTESSVNARLRDLRKEKFGGHVVERRYRGSGLHEYKLVVKS